MDTIETVKTKTWSIYVAGICECCWPIEWRRYGVPRNWTLIRRISCGGIAHAHRHGPYRIEAETEEEARTAALLHFQMDYPDWKTAAYVGENEPVELYAFMDD